jgi:hypothetical protein
MFMLLGIGMEFYDTQAKVAVVLTEHVDVPGRVIVHPIGHPDKAYEVQTSELIPGNRPGEKFKHPQR